MSDEILNADERVEQLVAFLDKQGIERRVDGDMVECREFPLALIFDEGWPTEDSRTQMRTDSFEERAQAGMHPQKMATHSGWLPKWLTVRKVDGLHREGGTRNLHKQHLEGGTTSGHPYDTMWTRVETFADEFSFYAELIRSNAGKQDVEQARKALWFRRLYNLTKPEEVPKHVHVGHAFTFLATKQGKSDNFGMRPDAISALRNWGDRFQTETGVDINEWDVPMASYALVHEDAMRQVRQYPGKKQQTNDPDKVVAPEGGYLHPHQAKALGDSLGKPEDQALQPILVPHIIKRQHYGSRSKPLTRHEVEVLAERVVGMEPSEAEAALENTDKTFWDEIARQAKIAQERSSVTRGKEGKGFHYSYGDKVRRAMLTVEALISAVRYDIRQGADTVGDDKLAALVRTRATTVDLLNTTVDTLIEDAAENLGVDVELSEVKQQSDTDPADTQVAIVPELTDYVDVQSRMRMLVGYMTGSYPGPLPTFSSDELSSILPHVGSMQIEAVAKAQIRKYLNQFWDD